jgi:hypothetical protein
MVFPGASISAISFIISAICGTLRPGKGNHVMSSTPSLRACHSRQQPDRMAACFIPPSVIASYSQLKEGTL